MGISSLYLGARHKQAGQLHYQLHLDGKCAQQVSDNLPQALTANVKFFLFHIVDAQEARERAQLYYKSEATESLIDPWRGIPNTRLG